jgi:hypothetical protein
MLIAVLAIALLVGTVSAGLLGYYGKLTITGTVAQSVKLNGKTWDVPTPYTGVALVGGDIWRTPDIQTITNGAGTSETILLETTVSDEDPIAQGVTYGYEFRLSIPADGNAKPYGYDNLKMKSWPALTLGGITSLTLEYYLVETEAGDSPYFVLITEDGWELVNDQKTGAPTGEWRQYDALTCNWHLDFYAWSGPWSDIAATWGDKKVTSIIVGYGLWGTAVRETAWVRNILVNGYSVIDNGIIIPADSNHSYAYEWTKYDNRNIEFKLRLEFPNNFVGTFAAETTVKPAP